MSETDFPLEFPFSRVFAERLEGEGVTNKPFVVVGMLTANYAEKARRLVNSCRKFRLPHIIYEVPTVHHSISPKGSADPRLTKANFIQFLLEKLNKPVLYLDVDTYFAQYPEAIENLATSGCEFAIYNWLADEHTEAYKPVEVNIGSSSKPIISRNRFFVYSHSIDHFSTDQLICSGAVQFYANTSAAKNLLRAWHNAVVRFGNVADDQCLDFAYNNFPGNEEKPVTRWLDKSYARYAFWIHVRPIINHPDMPYLGSGCKSIDNLEGGKRLYPERLQKLNVDYIFPKNCVIDVERKFLCKADAGQLVPFAKIDRALWI